MKKIVLATLVLLAGCDSGDKNSSTASDNTIVLECSGQYIHLATSNREAVSYLIKINPSNQFQQSLHFFNDEEKRFVSHCIGRFPECRVEVNSDLITEHGVMRDSENKLLLQELTTINRRTGEMRVVLRNRVFGDQLGFEGKCIKGELPTEQLQKF